MLQDPTELEVSPLSGPHTRDGVTVEVQIYRVASTNERWSLEVTDSEQASTVWSDTFPTDQEAFREFYRTIEEEGIRTFLDAKS